MQLSFNLYIKCHAGECVVGVSRRSDLAQRLNFLRLGWDGEWKKAQSWKLFLEFFFPLVVQLPHFPRIVSDLRYS